MPSRCLTPASPLADPRGNILPPEKFRPYVMPGDEVEELRDEEVHALRVYNHPGGAVINAVILLEHVLMRVGTAVRVKV